jgi:hypothetical protein
MRLAFEQPADIRVGMMLAASFVDHVSSFRDASRWYSRGREVTSLAGRGAFGSDCDLGFRREATAALKDRRRAESASADSSARSAVRVTLQYRTDSPQILVVVVSAGTRPFANSLLARLPRGDPRDSRSPRRTFRLGAEVDRQSLVTEVYKGYEAAASRASQSGARSGVRSAGQGARSPAPEKEADRKGSEQLLRLAIIGRVKSWTEAGQPEGCGGSSVSGLFARVGPGPPNCESNQCERGEVRLRGLRNGWASGHGEVVDRKVE